MQFQDAIILEKVCISWSEILRLFVNTLTAERSILNCNVHNFMRQQVQTPLSAENKGTFFGLFIPFVKCA